MQIARTTRHLWHTYIRPVSISAWARDAQALTRARTLVSYYYYVIPLLAFTFLQASFSGRTSYDPFWPLWWSGSLEFTTVVTVVKLLFIVASLLGLLFHRFLLVRMLVFLAIWQVHAFESSFGHINHQWYGWLYTSFVFVFLPAGWHQAGLAFARARSFLLYVWFAQALVMLTYTLAGMHKWIAVVTQYLAGEIHGLHVQAFAYQSADMVLRLQSEAILAPSVIMHPEWWWPFYAGFYFIQVAAFWVMIRPSLQRSWAFLLIVFHFGTMLTMGITFSQSILLLIVLFFHTPFHRPYRNVHEFIRDLPVIGQVVEWLAAERKSRV
ncbi:MAG: hypothetical protein WDZ93_02755 [Candidatus Paceibacterota bacterium]